MSSVKRKLNVKSLGEKCQALGDLEKGPQTKTSVKNMIYLVVKPSSIEITNALNTLQNLCHFHEDGNDMLELLQRFDIIDTIDILKVSNKLVIARLRRTICPIFS